MLVVTVFMIDEFLTLTNFKGISGKIVIELMNPKDPSHLHFVQSYNAMGSNHRRGISKKNGLVNRP